MNVIHWINFICKLSPNTLPFVSLYCKYNIQKIKLPLKMPIFYNTTVKRHRNASMRRNICVYI